MTSNSGKFGPKSAHFARFSFRSHRPGCKTAGGLDDERPGSLSHLRDADVAERAGFVDLVEDVDDGVRLIKIAALALTHMSEHSVFASSKNERGCRSLGYPQAVCQIGGIDNWLFHQRFWKLSDLRPFAMTDKVVPIFQERFDRSLGDATHEQRKLECRDKLFDDDEWVAFAIRLQRIDE